MPNISYYFFYFIFLWFSVPLSVFLFLEAYFCNTKHISVPQRLFLYHKAYFKHPLLSEAQLKMIQSRSFILTFLLTALLYPSLNLNQMSLLTRSDSSFLACFTRSTWKAKL